MKLVRRQTGHNTAQGNHAGALVAPMSLVPVSQVPFGTDFPFRRGAKETEGLTAFRFTSRDLRAIDEQLRDLALRNLVTPTPPYS